MLVVAVVAIIVVGPKDLPKMLRSFGKVMGNMRRMAGDFQKQFDDAVREADLDEVKNVASGKGFAPLDDVRKATEKYNRDLKQSIEDAGSGKNKAASAGNDPGAVTEESLPEPATPAKPPAAAKKPVKSTSKPAAKASANAAAKKPAARKTAAKKPAPKKAAPKKAAKTS